MVLELEAVASACSLSLEVLCCWLEVSRLQACSRQAKVHVTQALTFVTAEEVVPQTSA